MEDQNPQVEKPKPGEVEPKAMIFIFISIIAMILAYLWISNKYRNTDPITREAISDDVIIVYEIQSTGNVYGISLTYENDTGGTNQGDYEVPFSKRFTNFERGDFVYISAQIIEPTSGAGSIVCRIYQDNEIIAEGEASGFPSIATCSGSVE